MSTKTRDQRVLQWVLLTICGIFFLRTAPGHAQEVDSCQTSEECDALDARATDYFDQNDYARALIDFQSAYRLSSAPRLLVNLGRCFHRLGRPEEAVRYYERAQKEVLNPSPELAARLLRYLAEARAVLAAERAVAPRVPPPPIYQRPWLWGVVGVMVISIAVGTGLGLGLQANEPRLVRAIRF